MPASTVDPLTALRNALYKNNVPNIRYDRLTGLTRRVFGTEIEFEPGESYQESVLEKLKSKYIVLKSNAPTLVRDTDMGVDESLTEPKQVLYPSESVQLGWNNAKWSSGSGMTNIGNSCRDKDSGTDETLSEPKRVLYPIESVQLGWNNSEWSVGAGMVNMGNTCYLNSILQALFHVPALVNWLLSDKQHLLQCEDSGGGQVGCIICAMSKTLQASQQRNTNAIRPWLVFSKLRLVCRHLVPGRQEDAHEFLRYLVEAMEKAYIQRFRNSTTLDSRSKETTPLNQILGGYLRSTVRCLECKHASTTFQHFQDLLLDIRKVNTVDDALDNYFTLEKLDGNSYQCENCKKKVSATKQFSLERAPMVLCIQLKRFFVTNNKITKHVTFRQRLDITQYAKRKPPVPLIYRLVAVVTHMGATVSCGHYTAIAQAPSGSFYQFDDSTVRLIPHQALYNTNAYIMLYELDCSQSAMRSLASYKTATKTISSTPNTSKLVTQSSSVSGSAMPSPLHLNNSFMNILSTSSHTQNNSWQPTVTNGSSSNNHSDSTSDSNDSESESVVPKSNVRTLSVQPENNVNTNTKTNNASISENNYRLGSTSLSNMQSDHRPHTQADNSRTNQYSKNQSNSEASGSKQGPSVPDTSVKAEGSASQSNCDRNSESDKFVKRITPIQPREHNGIKSSQPTQPMTKLVPYEIDDSSCSAEECSIGKGVSQGRSVGQDHVQNQQVVTKATVGTWKVSPTPNSFHGPSLEGQAGWNRRRESVSELLHYSHDGYAAPVTTWNGHRAQLNREIGNERREERKRALTDNVDRGRIKYPKPNLSHMLQYNPFQELCMKKMPPHGSHYRKPYYAEAPHRYNNKRMNYQYRHREKFRH